MAETWTFSEWTIGPADPAQFVDAFVRFADAAASLGGAHEGMILQDLEDPRHFVVVRRWAGPGDVHRLADEQGGHGEDLRAMAPEGGRGCVMTKVAELTPAPAGGIDAADG